MLHTFRTSLGTRSKSRAVRKHLAQALVGQTVDLLVDAHTIVHGVVTGVMNDAGAPKLVVCGTGYDLNQILTAMPAALDQGRDKWPVTSDKSDGSNSSHITHHTSHITHHSSPSDHTSLLSSHLPHH